MLRHATYSKMVSHSCKKIQSTDKREFNNTPKNALEFRHSIQISGKKIDDLINCDQSSSFLWGGELPNTPYFIFLISMKIYNIYFNYNWI